MRAASMNPEDFTSGLRDDFRGTITKIDYVAWDYGGREDDDGKPIVTLAAKAIITPHEDEDDSEAIEQFYSAAAINRFVPSLDGDDPCGHGPDPRDEEGEEVDYELGVEGNYAVPVSRATQLAKSSNWATFIRSVLETGSEHFGAKDLTPNIQCYVGLDAHWNRIKTEKRGDFGGNEVLQVTDIYGYGKAKPAKATKATKAKATKPADPDPEPDGDDTVESRVSTLIGEVLDNNEGNPVPRAKVVGASQKLDKTEKPAAMKLINDVAWLKEQGYVFAKGKIGYAA